MESDLFRPGLRAGAFDVVYCSGVLHHTPDPRAAFAQVARLARPGGMIVLGLYNAVARLPLRLRRVVARVSGYRWIPFDPSCATGPPSRRGARPGCATSTAIPRSTGTRSARCWVVRGGRVDFVRAYPCPVHDDVPDPLRAGARRLGAEGWLAQVGWMGSLGGEGGLFVTIGRGPEVHGPGHRDSRRQGVQGV